MSSQLLLEADALSVETLGQFSSGAVSVTKDLDSVLVHSHGLLSEMLSPEKVTNAPKKIPPEEISPCIICLYL